MKTSPKLSFALCSASVAAIILAFAPAAHAADDADSANDGGREIIVKGSRTEAEEGYKVTNSRSGTRTDTPLVDTPQSVTVITAKQIEDQGAGSIGEAIRYTPGIYSAQGEGNRETLVIRGMTTTGDFFVDGIRDDVQTYRDLYNIQTLEVFRGPNAMAFGRGGTGGLINRVTKVADWDSVNELRLEVGMHDHYRGALDVGTALSDTVAVRATGIYQNSGSYRDGVEYERWGINPTVAFRAGDNTLIQAGYEHFEDDRIADRGVPSQFRPTGFVGAVEPLKTPRDQFFGDPANSKTWTDTDAFNLYISHDFGNGVTLRNRTRYADYTKFYENVFTTGLAAAATNTAVATPRPGVPVGSYAAGELAGISAYNTLTTRENFINQTDLNAEFNTGGIKHTLLVGAEFGSQKTDNLGQNGLFPVTAPGVTSPTGTIYVPVSASQISRNDIVWVSNRSSNFGTTNIVAGYIQDQIELSPQLQVIVGARYEHLTTDVTNRLAGNVLTETTDDLWSPRGGLIYKPAENASIYASFSRSYLPRSGDQLTSLAPTNATLAPERYQNFEIGAKWDINPGFNVSAAVYQLDRDNVIVLIDPANPAAGTELGGGQRSRGFELAFAGKITPELSLVGSYNYQETEFVRAISATVQNGARIPNAPRHSASLWGRYQVTPQFGIALGGNVQGERYAAQDNLVRLPGYARLDGALFYKLNDKIELQVNVENLTNTHYYLYAHSNTNITPGAPTTVKASLNATF